MAGLRAYTHVSSMNPSSKHSLHSIPTGKGISMCRNTFAVTLTTLVAAALTACNQVPAPSPPREAAPTILTDAQWYDLRERCGHTAREWFKQFYGSGATNSASSSAQSGYENHYDSKLNRCFARLTTTSADRDAKTRKIISTVTTTLADVDENAELGTYSATLGPLHQLECQTDAGSCANRNEWYNWANKLMSE